MVTFDLAFHFIDIGTQLLFVRSASALNLEDIAPLNALCYHALCHRGFQFARAQVAL